MPQPQPPEMSGRKFLLLVLLPAMTIFAILLIVLGPDKPIGGPSSFYPTLSDKPTPTPTPTPSPAKP